MGIRFENISKVFNSANTSFAALDDVSFDVSDGEFVCLVGPSGCGKSTLLNMLAGFEHPSTGKIVVDAQEIHKPSLEHVLMFQEATLFPWLNAIDNVAFGLKSLRLPRKQQLEIAQQYIDMVHLNGFEHAQPHELSGGMKSRVALARALAVQPRLLLMDEPFAALDAQTRDNLIQELERLWLETKKTVLFVTHNVNEAVALGTRVIVFSPRPGRIETEVSLTHLDRPRHHNDPGVVEAIGQIQRALRPESNHAPQTALEPKQ